MLTSFLQPVHPTLSTLKWDSLRRRFLCTVHGYLDLPIERIIKHFRQSPKRDDEHEINKTTGRIRWDDIRSAIADIVDTMTEPEMYGDIPGFSRSVGHPHSSTLEIVSALPSPPALPPFEAFRCLLCCDVDLPTYAINENSLKTHMSRKHRDMYYTVYSSQKNTNNPNEFFKHVTIQRIYADTSRRHRFEVTIPTRDVITFSSPSHPSVVNAAWSAATEKHETTTAEEAGSSRLERPIDRTLAKFSEFTDGIDKDVLIELVKRTPPQYARLDESMRRVVLMHMHAVDKMHRSKWMTYVLSYFLQNGTTRFAQSRESLLSATFESLDHEFASGRGTVATAWFNPVQNPDSTIRDYSLYMTYFIRAITASLCATQAESTKLMFTLQVQRQVEQLWHILDVHHRELTTTTRDDDLSDDCKNQLLATMQAFLVQVFSETSNDTLTNQLELTVMRFMAITFALPRERSNIDGDELVRVGHVFMRWMRNVALYHIVRQAESNSPIPIDQLESPDTHPIIINIRRPAGSVMFEVQGMLAVTKTATKYSNRPPYKVLWDEQFSRFSCHGVTISVEKYSSVIRAMWIQCLEDMLDICHLGDFFESNQNSPRFATKEICDDMANGEIGYSFLNSNYVRQLGEMFVRHLTSRWLLIQSGNDIPCTDPTNLLIQCPRLDREDFVKASLEIQRRLLIASYLSSGRPFRGSEIGSLLLRNIHSHYRGMFVVFGQVCFIPNHEKMAARTFTLSNSARFLSRECSQKIVIPYFVFIRQALIAVAHSLEDHQCRDNLADYVWLNPNTRRPFSGVQFGNALRLEMSNNVDELSVWGPKTYRQIILNHYDRFFASKEVEMRSGINQAAHLKTTEMQHYGWDNRHHPQVKLLQLEENRLESSWQHQWLGLDVNFLSDSPLSAIIDQLFAGEVHPVCRRPVQTLDTTTDLSPISPSTHHHESYDDIITTAVRQGCARVSSFTELLIRDVRHAVSTNSLQRNNTNGTEVGALSRDNTTALTQSTSTSIRQQYLVLLGRKLFSRSHFEFRSPEQMQHCMEAIFETRDVVCVMPTSEGKTLAIQLVAMHIQHLHLNQVAIVLVPLRAPLQRMVNEVEHLGINATVYHSVHDKLEFRRHSLLVVSVDIASTSHFREQLLNWANSGHVFRVFIDEAHMLLDQVVFRHKFFNTGNLRDRTTFPLTLQSATIPPSMVSNFERIFSTSFVTLRKSTFRIDIQYFLRKVEDGNSDDHDRAGASTGTVRATTNPSRTPFIHELHELIDIVGKYDKSIVFVWTKAEAETIRDFLQSNVTTHPTKPSFRARAFHSDLDDDDLSRILRAFENNEFQCLVSTSAGGTGTNYLNVQATIHFGPPRSLTSLHQESGRVGRKSRINAKVWSFSPSAYILTSNRLEKDRFHQSSQADKDYNDLFGTCMKDYQQVLQMIHANICWKQQLAVFVDGETMSSGVCCYSAKPCHAKCPPCTSAGLLKDIDDVTNLLGESSSEPEPVTTERSSSSYASTSESPQSFPLATTQSLPRVHSRLVQNASTSRGPNQAHIALITFKEAVDQIACYGCPICLISNGRAKDSWHDIDECPQRFGRCLKCCRKGHSASKCPLVTCMPNQQQYCFWCGWHSVSMGEHAVQCSSTTIEPRSRRLRWQMARRSARCQSGLSDLLRPLVALLYESHQACMPNAASASSLEEYMQYCYPPMSAIMCNRLPGDQFSPILVNNHFSGYVFVINRWIKEKNAARSPAP